MESMHACMHRELYHPCANYPQLLKRHRHPVDFSLSSPLLFHRRFGVTRAHLEEDAGKIVYSGADRMSGAAASLVDYNRAGVPLLEIVSDPDMRSGKDAAAYGEELRRLMRFLGISDGNMSEGSMR